MTINQPLVSIGIPTYNRPLGLRRVLEEIANQTYANIEIIISDNHSPEEETERIAREFMEKDARIRYVRQTQNIGIFNNYKFLLEQAQGEYFAWVCDDDFRHPEYVAACIQEFERLKTPVLVNSYSARLHPQSGEVMVTDKGCTTLGMRSRDRYIKYISTIFTAQAAVGDILYGIVKRDALARVMKDQVNIIAWDHVVLANLALNSEFYTIPRQLMSASVQGASASFEHTARSQLIAGSLSEKMPIWVKEIYLQRTIWESSRINLLEKLLLSIWSYGYYFLTHGFKMWVKGMAPDLFNFLKHTLRVSPKATNSSPG